MARIELFDQDGNLKEERQPDPPAPVSDEVLMARSLSDAGYLHSETKIELIDENGVVKDERRA